MAKVTLVIALLSVLVFKSHAQLHNTREGVALIYGTMTQGFVELSYDGRQGLLCADTIGREEGQVICHDLGLPNQYPSIQELPAPADAAFVGSHVNCHGNEVKLSDCRHDNWNDAVCATRLAAFISCQADPCVPSPCQNGGQCQMTSSDLGHQCDCTSAWSGLHCASDVNECLTNNGGCSDACVNADGGYSCECTREYLHLGSDNHTCIVPGEHVTCTSQAMVLTFEKAVYPSLHREHLTLSDASCVASDNVTHIILRAPLSGCGTTSQMSGTSITYSNVVHSKEEVVEGVISRVKEVKIPFQCVMDREEIHEVPVDVDIGELHFLLEGSGRHDVDLHFSSNGKFQLGQGQVSVYPGQEIHGQVTLTTIDPNLSVALNNCSATTSIWHNSTDTPYAVLENGCPQDTTLVLSNVTQQMMQQFHMEAFKFLNNHDQVAFHCDVTLCDQVDDHSFCAQGCQATTH